MPTTATPPTDKQGELKKAVILLDRWRKQLDKDFPGKPEWQRYVAQSLLGGLESEVQK